MNEERVCARCGTRAGSSRWCSGCGVNLELQGELPTLEAFEAKKREGAWLKSEEAAKRRDEERRQRQADARAAADRQRRGQETGKRRVERRQRQPRKRGVLLFGLVLAVLAVGGVAVWQMASIDIPGVEDGGGSSASRPVPSPTRQVQRTVSDYLHSMVTLGPGSLAADLLPENLSSSACRQVKQALDAFPSCGEALAGLSKVIVGVARAPRTPGVGAAGPETVEFVSAVKRLRPEDLHAEVQGDQATVRVPQLTSFDLGPLLRGTFYLSQTHQVWEIAGFSGLGPPPAEQTGTSSARPGTPTDRDSELIGTWAGSATIRYGGGSTKHFREELSIGRLIPGRVAGFSKALQGNTECQGPLTYLGGSPDAARFDYMEMNTAECFHSSELGVILNADGPLRYEETTPRSFSNGLLQRSDETVDDRSSCEDVGITPASDNVVSDIRVVGMHCTRVRIALFEWGAAGYPGGGPGKFACRSIPTTTGLGGTEYHCTQGRKVLNFTSY